jgi:succinate dehydrogenase / fumarate reductase cytochrome b subunit
MGLWLVLFLMEHLVTNSQAALWLGDRGAGFVRMVNTLHNLPYLQVIEWTLLGIPLLLHMGLGIQYALRAKSNAHKTDGSRPSLLKYGRNRAYSWQRITSWVLAVLLLCHVVKFRFLDYPTKVMTPQGFIYLTKIKQDPKLETLSWHLGVRLYDSKAIGEEKKKAQVQGKIISSKQVIWQVKEIQKAQNEFIQKLTDFSLRGAEVVAESSNFGAITLLKVRETFQSPMYCVLYTIFVLATCFHAFNGLWTFILSWGLVIRLITQRALLRWTIGLMVIIAMLGLLAIWGSS